MSKAWAARQLKRRYPFTNRTRLFDLIKAKYHPALATWLMLIRPFLAGGKVPDWKTASRLDFICRQERLVWCVAALLKEIGIEGLKCKKSVFFRYLTSKEHSNITLSEDRLKTLVNSQIRYGLLPCN